MNKVYVILVLISLNSCQFFMPTSSIDNEPVKVELNENFYLVSDFNYSILKKNKQEVDLVVCDSVDSLFIGKKIILYRKNDYFVLNNDSIIQIKEIPKNRLKSVKTFFE
jgi:hypothetical protein